MPQANTNPNAFYASDATQKQVTYAMLGGSQPGPVTHALSHLDNGTDVVPVVTTTRTGLTPKLSGTATTFLDGTGAYSAPGWAGITGKPSNFAPLTTFTGFTIPAFYATVNVTVASTVDMIQGGTYVLTDGRR